MQFVKFGNEVYAYHEEESASLARYMVGNMDYVQFLKDEVRITCNKTFTFKLMKVGSNGKPMLDLRTTLDTASLWKLAQSIKLYQGLYYGA